MTAADSASLWSVPFALLGAKPLSVHEWLPGDAHGLECWASNLVGLFRTDERRGPTAASCADDTKVLHYPVCSSAALLEKWSTRAITETRFDRAESRYNTLGHFPNSWFAGNAPIPASFHRDCRDIFSHTVSAHEPCYAHDVAADLFHRYIALTDGIEVARQLTLGVCTRFDAIGCADATLACNSRHSPSRRTRSIGGGSIVDVLRSPPRPHSQVASPSNLATGPSILIDADGTAARAVAAGIERNGFAITRVAKTLMETFTRGRSEVDHLDTSGKLAPGKVAARGANVADRADKVVWLTDISASASTHLAEIRSAINAFVARCVPWLSAHEAHDASRQHAPFVLSESTDTMLAVYGADGCAYSPHIDNFDGDGRCGKDEGRLLTVVAYLNAQTWGAHRGGHLRLHSKTGRCVDVCPTAGTIVLFRADTLVHEVRPAFVTRRAMTVWHMGRRETAADHGVLRSE